MIRWHLNLWGRFIQQTVLGQLASHLENKSSFTSIKMSQRGYRFQFKNKTTLQLWNGGNFQSLTPKTENIKEKAKKLDCIKT